MFLEIKLFFDNYDYNKLATKRSFDLINSEGNNYVIV